MSAITAGITRQYADSTKLAARGRLHRDFSVAKVPWFAWVAERLELTAGSRVLDVGCGPGWFWNAVSGTLPNTIDLTLLDQSKGMVDEATERCRSLHGWTVRGVEADATSLPFEDGSVDTVVAMHMLYHVVDQAAAIAEMHRVLKPGGRLVVTTNGVNNMRELYALTTVFGSAPTDPAASAFGFDTAERLLHEKFGNVTSAVHPGGLRVTDPEVVFLALTSYPPGDGASEDQLAAFQAAIDAAFARGNGVLEVANEVGLFASCKAD